MDHSSDNYADAADELQADGIFEAGKRPGGIGRSPALRADAGRGQAR